MSYKVVISQPMLFPWVGLFEQLRLSDEFVHYDDVQLPMGRSFVNRVQIKTKDGIVWMTVPLQRASSKADIKEVLVDNSSDWRSRHLKMLEHAFSKCPFKDDALGIVSDIYGQRQDRISDINISAFETVAKYFDIGKVFSKSSELMINGASSQRLLDICKDRKATVYITGLGALHYIDYSLFENNNIKIHFMDYEKKQYSQQHGEFTPYVSILDLIANCGRSGVVVIKSSTLYWSDFVHQREAFDGS